MPPRVGDTVTFLFLENGEIQQRPAKLLLVHEGGEVGDLEVLFGEDESEEGSQDLADAYARPKVFVHKQWGLISYQNNIPLRDPAKPPCFNKLSCWEPIAAPQPKAGRRARGTPPT